MDVHIGAVVFAMKRTHSEFGTAPRHRHVAATSPVLLLSRVSAIK